MSVEVKFKPVNTIVADLGLNKGGRVHKFFTQTCAIHMDKYVPFDTGTLATTADEQPNAVIYEQPYAR